MNKIVAQITWMEQDFFNAFKEQFGREPSKLELSNCLKKIGKTIRK